MAEGRAVPRVKMIACSVLARECHAVAARSRRVVDLELLEQGLHDLGAEGMRGQLQEAIDRSKGYSEVLLGYGLCNNGVVGLRARETPLVVAKVHDCISILLGSAKRYQEEFDKEPGTYYLTGGWLERDKDMKHPPGSTVRERLGIGKTLEAYAAQYGEENAKYLVETLGEGLTHYTRVAFIEMGLGPEEGFEELARKKAEEQGLRLEKLAGNMRLLAKLADGDYAGDEFLVVPPGGEIEADYTGCVMRAKKQDQ